METDSHCGSNSKLTVIMIHKKINTIMKIAHKKQYSGYSNLCVVYITV